MRTGGVALLILLLYLVFVFIAYRVLDLVSWWHYGITSAQVVDPIGLSVKQLKQLLDVRGVKYTGYVEKKELAELAEQSGDVTVGEVEELGDDQGAGAAEFSGAPHLYEQVEDTKDSIWLVQVGTRPLLDDLTWHLVRRHLAPFHVRTGVFDCSLDPGLCASKGWHEPLLLLAMPRGTRPKDKVFMRTTRLSRPQAIVDWLRDELSSRVHQIHSVKELRDEWLQPSNSSYLRVLLLTHLLHPPLFLAALSLKFSGRIKFGIMTVKKGEEVGVKVPSYLVVTPDGQVYEYGRQAGEHINLSALHSFLRLLKPDINDVFLSSLLVVNVLVLFISLQREEVWWGGVVVCMLKAIAANLCLLVGWLGVMWAGRWQPVATLGDLLAGLPRTVALTPLGALLRWDLFRLWSLPPPVTALSLLLFGMLSVKILRRLGFIPAPSPRTTTYWDWLFRSGGREGGAAEAETLVIDVEEAMLDRLAVPDLWLRPDSVPTEYIARLPVFKFGKRDSPGAVEAMMDGSRQVPSDCAVCLERYRPSALLCALPCGHVFHHKCVLGWLHRDHHHCPLCRWPAYRPKSLRKDN